MNEDVEANKKDPDSHWKAIESQWVAIEDEWGVLGEEWDKLRFENQSQSAGTMVNREMLPSIIEKFQAGMTAKQISVAEEMVRKLDTHILFAAQTKLSLLEAGFDKDEAFTLLLGYMGMHVPGG